MTRSKAPAPSIDFRPLRRDDFPTLAGWLVEPHIARWWADDATPAGLEADYGGCIDGSEPAEVFVACVEEQALGFVQRYRLAAYPDYRDELAALAPIPPGAWGIDYLIGPPSLIGRGWGRAMVERFVGKLWQDDIEAVCVVVATHADNPASWRTLASAGFARVAAGDMAPDNPADDRRHLVYRLDRPLDVAPALNAATAARRRAA
ncbi:MAG TPA: GNAT family N-acetyltransferase [Methylibium sp.]|uniref:GNAT family N-acetyltransferase n=1 Tax=Methylibium sp. TaxID=2067992 RepID=UPI002DBA0151|nr:GNAT family N-acetyltransferase [Methylibium sp.]HEU4459778.1 GNAT family N-acetyltransferase [Methylibium sp.]